MNHPHTRTALYSLFVRPLQSKEEGSSAPDFGFAPDAAVMTLGNFLAGGKSKSSSFVFPNTMQAFERCEDFLAVLFGNTNFRYPLPETASRLPLDAMRRCVYKADRLHNI